MLSTDAKYLPEPRGEILDPGPALLEADADTLRLYEEEVTSGGTEVTRRYQLSAWHTGRAHLWSGRRVRAGHSESSSDLRFDVLEERTDHGATAGGGLASDAGPPLSGSKDGLGSTDTSDGNDMDDE